MNEGGRERRCRLLTCSLSSARRRLSTASSSCESIDIHTHTYIYIYIYIYINNVFIYVYQKNNQLPPLLPPKRCQTYVPLPPSLPPSLPTCGGRGTRLGRGARKREALSSFMRRESRR